MCEKSKTEVSEEPLKVGTCVETLTVPESHDSGKLCHLIESAALGAFGKYQQLNSAYSCDTVVMLACYSTHLKPALNTDNDH